MINLSFGVNFKDPLIVGFWNLGGIVRPAKPCLVHRSMAAPEVGGVPAWPSKNRKASVGRKPPSPEVQQILTSLALINNQENKPTSSLIIHNCFELCIWNISIRRWLTVACEPYMAYLRVIER